MNFNHRYQQLFNKHRNIKDFQNLLNNPEYIKYSKILDNLIYTHREFKSYEIPISNSPIFFINEDYNKCLTKDEVIDICYNLDIVEIYPVGCDKDNYCLKFLVSLVNDNFSKYHTLPLLAKAMDNAGYYDVCTYVTNHSVYGVNSVLCVVFEPYILTNDIVHSLSDKIYRVVKSKYKDEILKDGFIPRCGSCDQKYPPRVYFFLNQDYDDFINIYVPTLYDVHKFEKPKGENLMNIFEVDTKKITTQIFYFDRRYTDYKNRSVWTYDAIPANIISNIGELWI